jgi:hypothetical protein
MKSKLPLITAACIAAFVLGTSVNAAAKAKKSPSPSPSAETSASPMAQEKPARPMPYHGKVASVDATAKTFMVGSRTFKVTDETKITKQGAAATMSDITAEEEVRGSYWKKDDGSLEAKTVKVGAMTADEKAKHHSRKQKSDEGAATSPSASPKP